MENELKPLPKEITDEIRMILEGCQSGKLKHDQETFFCGTYRCIAGWKVSFDKAKENKSWLKKSLTDEKALKILGVPIDGPSYFWTYAQDAWELSSPEADIFFGLDSHYKEQFELLDQLENGQRIPDELPEAIDIEESGVF